MRRLLDYSKSKKKKIWKGKNTFFIRIRRPSLKHFTYLYIKEIRVCKNAAHGQTDFYNLWFVSYTRNSAITGMKASDPKEDGLERKIRRKFHYTRTARANECPLPDLRRFYRRSSRFCPHTDPSPQT